MWVQGEASIEPGARRRRAGVDRRRRTRSSRAPTCVGSVLGAGGGRGAACRARRRGRCTTARASRHGAPGATTRSSGPARCVKPDVLARGRAIVGADVTVASGTRISPAGGVAGRARAGSFGCAGHGDRRRGLHRLEARRPAPRRGLATSTSSTTSRPARSRTWRPHAAQPDRRFSFHRLDVALRRVVDLIAHRSPDVVFHLAAQIDVRVSVARPVFDATVNIIGSLNVCEGAVAAGRDEGRVRRIRAERCTASPERIPDAESQPQTPGVAVRRREEGGRRLPLLLPEIARARVHRPGASRTCTGRARTRTARPGSSRSSRPSCSRRARPLIFGDGSQTRDFVYVDDVVDAFVRAVDKGGGLTVEHRYRRRDERAAALRRHGDAHRLSRGRRERSRPRPARCSAARSTRAAPRSTSAGSRGRRWRRAWPARSSGSRPSAAGAR